MNKITKMGCPLFIIKNIYTEVYFMYELSQEDAMTLMKSRNDNEILIPVYVIVGDEKYSLFDINSIAYCSRSIFKVGFVTGVYLFGKNNFPEDRLFEFDNQTIYTEFDIDKNIEYKCYVLETGLLISNDSFAEYVNNWIDLIFDKIMVNVNEIKKERIKRTMEELS
jgi:hypothetical protein